MAPEKRNNFLDASDSDEEEGHYDSEGEDLRKGGRGSKRRKLDDDEVDQSDDDARIVDEEETERGASRIKKSKAKKTTTRREEEEEEDDDDEDDDEDDNDKTDVSIKKAKKAKASAKDSDDEQSIKLPGVDKPLTKKNLVATEKAVRRSGVIYISRIPPFMKPGKLRTLLEPYGKINRTYLSPEDPLSHTRRVRGGGNKRRSFVDGWVEFVRKKDAKRAVDLLNAQTIGGKKSSYYRDDIWSMVYLRGFKWHHLTEQIATENAERAGRMRAELQKTSRENKVFLQNVEQAKMLDGMEAKAAAKAGRTGGGAGDGGEAGSAKAPAAVSKSAAAPRKDTRSIKQKKMVSLNDNKGPQSEHVQRVLNKIF